MAHMLSIEGKLSKAKYHQDAAEAYEYMYEKACLWEAAEYRDEFRSELH